MSERSEESSSSSSGSRPVAAFPESLDDDDSTLLPDPDVDFPDLDPHPGSSSENDPTAFVKPGNKEGLEKGGAKGSSAELVPHYILGTLVVRVVAARDLEPVQKGGLGGIVFGSGKRAASKVGGGGGGGTANPYASVKFGDSTQRSSEVYDSLNPIWPRQEAMFMDVSLPASLVAHADATSESPTFETGGGSVEGNESSSSSTTYEKPPTVLTVAVFHTAEVGRVNKPSKGMFSGDSNDMFMGMASIDLQRLFTGREHTYDGWLSLSGTETSRGSVRLVCEYEPSDAAPRPGDYCRFTRYCNPRDLYPLQCGRQYRIAEVDGDTVLVSYTTPEGWVCTFQAHRFMLFCEERHNSTVEAAQDEFASVAERLSHSPLLHSITGTVERVAVDGLLDVGQELVHGGLGLFNRWFSGGLETVILDVTDVTNWDGRHNPDVTDELDLQDLRSSDQEDGDGEGSRSSRVNNSYHDDERMNSKLPAISHVALPSLEPEALPNMPACPITGFPMIDPVVAADGHTYERSAIARWLTTSSRSPMTGSVLPHKNLVTNYGLLSSVEDAARSSKSAGGRAADIPLRVDVMDESSSSVGLSLIPSMETMETIAVTPAAAAEYAQVPAMVDDAEADDHDSSASN